jgi:hypothetical protein
MAVKTKKKPKKEAEDDSPGMSLDDAFADDEDVVYAQPKPKKQKKKIIEEENEDSDDEGEAEAPVSIAPDIQAQLKQSKPASSLKKGDIIKVDGKDLEIDQHYVLMDHGTTKEMAIECFDKKTDKDYQIRYFSDQVPETIEFYELQGEIMFVKKPAKLIEW